MTLAQINPEDTLELSRLLLDAISGGRWTLVASLGVVLSVWVVRRFASPVWPVLADKRIALVLAILGPMAASMATALIGGQALTIGVLLSGLIAGLGAVGMWSAQKNVREAFRPPPPSAGMLSKMSAIGDRPPGQPLR